MEIDDAFLREQTPRAVEKGFMFTKHCIITDLQGNLRFFNAWESGAKIPEGFALSRPKPDNPQWRERGLRAVLAAHRANSDPGIRDFAQSLFGMGWREEALKYSNNLIPESVVMDILAAVGARFLAEAQTKYDAALQPFKPQEIDGVTLATKHMDVDVRRTSLKEMAESQYDFDEREITLKYISPYLATEFVPKLNAITQAVRDKLTAIKAAQNAEREAKDAAEKADQKAKQEALQASLSQVIPSDVLRALNDLGLQVSLNAMRMKWTPYKAKEAVIAEPGTYLVLFDPKGYGGPLSKAFQGQHDRNRKMGAVWNKDLKSWIMPIDGLDYDALLGAFD